MFPRDVCNSGIIICHFFLDAPLSSHVMCFFRIELSVGVFLLCITWVVLLLVLDKLCEEMHYVGTSLR